jgi:glutamate-1-semialdehyde aminotransferase
MALSAAVIGYAVPAIDEAVIRQIKKGFVFSVPSLLEAELAERLCERFPSVECVRFCKDGSDATSAAVRIARRVTGRSKIVIGSYHGWHDWSAVHYYGAQGASPQELGILRSVASETIWLPRETFAAFEAMIASVDCFAGVMICPENWSQNDIKSAIRYGPRGVAYSLGLAPDLMCLGKSIANGFPLAVLAGGSELMSLSNDVHFSTTAASEGISLAASLAVDDYLRAVEAWPPWHGRCVGIMSRVSSAISAINPLPELAISGYPGNFRVHTLE